MIRFFRNNPEGDSNPSWGFWVMVIVIGLIVAAFLVQLVVGLSPVP